MAGENTQNAQVVLTANTTQYQQQMTAAQSQTNGVTQSVVGLVSAINRLTTATGKGLVILGAGGLAGITAATAQAGRFEQQLSTLQATTAITGRSMGVVERGIENVSRKLPVTTGQITALSTALTKIGADPRNLEKLAEVFARLSGATGEDMTALAQGLTQLQQQMGTGAGSTEKYANSLAQLSANLGTSATATLSFAQNIAPVARSVGMTQTEVMGLSAAFAKSGQDGFTAANVFTKLISDINQATKYGSPQLASYANLIGKTTSEFKEMSSTDQITAIFEAIQKQGDGASKTLDRLGIDGTRAQRAIQGVANQSGGLSKALKEAQSGFNGNALGRGSNAAFDGLNDNLVKLRNNLASIGRDFGATFLPVANAMVKGLNQMASAAATLMRALAPVAGLIAGLGSIGAGASGALLTGATALGTIAAVQAVRRSSLGAGFRNAQSNATGSPVRSGTYRRSIASFEAGEGGPLQRRLFSAGQFLYAPFGAANAARQSAADRVSNSRVGDRLFGPRTEGPASAPGSRGGLISRGAMLASMGLQAPMGFIRAQMEPLQPRAMRDITQRGNPAGFVLNGREQWNAVATGQNASLGRAATGVTTAFTALIRASAGATAGLTEMGARAAIAGAGRGLASAGRNAGSLLARGGGALMGALGGPVGLAITGGVVAGGAILSGQAQTREYGDVLKSSQGATAATNAYAAALGLATTAVSNFTDAVRETTAESTPTAASAGVVSESDITTARAAGRQYTVDAVGQMSESQARAYAGTARQTNTDPKATQALKLDLIQRFGPAKASEILKEAGDNSFNVGGLVSSSNSMDWRDPFDVKTRKQDADSITRATDTAGVQRGQLEDMYGVGEADKYTSAVVNQLLSQVRNTSDRGTQVSLLNAIEQIAGTGKGSFDISQSGLNSITNARTDAQGVQAFYRAIQGTQEGRNFAQAANGNTSTTYTAPAAGSVPLTEREQNIRGSMAGAMARGNESIGATIQTALANEGDANLQITAANEWAQKLTSLTGSTTNAASQLQELKGRIQDAGDPLYKLAEAAQTATTRLQNIQAAYMTRGENAATTRANLASAYASNQNSPDYASRVQSAEDAYEGQRAQAFETLKGVVQAYRSFNIQQSRAQADFAVQRRRSDEDYNLQRKQSLEDFQLSQARGQDDYNRSRQRGEADFALSRKRALEDFDQGISRSNEDYNRSRQQGNEDFARSQERSQDDFNRSLQRGLRDYNISRQQSQEDFNLSRQRSEEDYQHNIVVMTAQSAKSISDIYKRTASSSTWSASSLLQNAQRQNRDMARQQANLTALRGAGLSGDAINQLGLNDPKNAQQAARMVADLAKNPMLVQEWNKAIAGRLDLAKAFVTDQDNPAYQEMERQFKLTAERAAEDFDRMAKRGAEAYQRGIADMTEDFTRMTERAVEDYARMTKRQDEDYARSLDRQQSDFKKSMDRSADDHATSMSRMADDYQRMVERAEDDYAKMLDRQNEAYAKSMARTVDDFNKQMSRAKEDINRSFEEITGSFSTLADEALGQLSGTAQKQMDALVTALGDMRTKIAEEAKGATADITLALQGVFTADYWASVTTTPYDSSKAPLAGMPGSGVYGPPSGAKGGGTDRDAIATAASTTVSPVPGATITSTFGTRKDPFTGESKSHKGIDFAAPTGTNVDSARPGTVSFAGDGGSFGNLVKINHGGGVESWYAHLSKILVAKGQQVTAGSDIGKVGSTGRSTGPHLHFQLMVNGTATDPTAFLNGTGSMGVSPALPDSNQARQMIAQAIAGSSNANSLEDARLGQMSFNPVMGRFKEALGNKIMEGYNKKVIELMQNSINGADGNGSYSSGPNTGSGVNYKGDRAANRALGQQLAAARGWTGNQWNALDRLWVGESGWNNLAQNPTSTAYGIAQFLNSTWKGTGYTKTSDPATQIAAGLKYIQMSYGNPINAYAKWSSRSPHWYSDGGIFTGAQTIGVGEHGSEAVLPLNQQGADFMAQTLARFATYNAQSLPVSNRQVVSGGSTTYNQQFNSGVEVTGPVTVQAQDPNDMLRKLEAQARLARLNKPAGK